MGADVNRGRVVGGGVGAVVGGRGSSGLETRAAVTRHIAFFHRQVFRYRVLGTNPNSLLDVIMKERVKMEVGSKSREVISIHKPGVCAVDNIHIPAHETHLKQ